MSTKKIITIALMATFIILALSSIVWAIPSAQEAKAIEIYNIHVRLTELHDQAEELRAEYSKLEAEAASLNEELYPF